VRRIRITTCPYGTLEQHLSGEIDCPLEDCIYRNHEGHQHYINKLGSKAVLRAIKESEEEACHGEAKKEEA